MNKFLAVFFEYFIDNPANEWFFFWLQFLFLATVHSVLSMLIVFLPSPGDLCVCVAGCACLSFIYTILN